MPPYAYLRKSVARPGVQGISWEMQEAAVREMAASSDLIILSDWNKSGRKGADKRPGYAQLLEAIESGHATAVFSYSLSRLSRSLADFSSLVELCQRKGVPIRLYSEQHLDFSSAAGRLMISILAAFAQMEAELAQERARDAVAARRARGDRIGGRFYDDPDVVVAAYREAGSLSGAAKLLTAQGIPTRNGGSVWRPTSVRGILQRVAPHELPHTPAPGAKKAAPFLFYRLLRCQCGRFLTGVRYKNGRRQGYVAYRCLQGRWDLRHERQTVPETAVLEWARAEAALARPPVERIQIAEQAQEKVEALTSQKIRLGRAYAAGALPEGEFQSGVEAIDAELDELELLGRSIELGPIDWDVDPQLINALLRALWEYVELGPDQRPVRAEWRLRAWRSTPEGPPAPGG